MKAAARTSHGLPPSTSDALLRCPSLHCTSTLLALPDPESSPSMDYDPNKRLRTTSGAPLSTTTAFSAANPAASLPPYTPPPIPLSAATRKRHSVRQHACATYHYSHHQHHPHPPPATTMPPNRRTTRTSTTIKLARDSTRPYPNRTDSHNSSASSHPLASVTSHGSGKLRLTVKAQPSRLRQATSGASFPPASYAETSESDATPVPPTRTARSTRNPRTVVEPDSDDLEDEEDEDEDADEDEDEDAEGEIDDTAVDGEDSEEADEDDEMEDMSEHPPPPIIKQARVNGKPNVVVTAPPEGPLKSVEAKEMEDDDDDDEDDDDELSELESEGEGNENDADENEDEEEGDSDDENGSRSATPDLSKLTRRQRGFYEEAEDPNLMALSNEAQKKKHLTVEEHAMRRQEMAKRRKNLSEKRNEEEKMDTINKLLSKPAPKRRTRAEIIAQERAEGLTPGAEEGDVERPDVLSIRWVNSRAGSRIGVPEEWLEKPVGEVFQPTIMAVGSRRLVQEVS
nr:ino80 complex subunit 2 [Quercus suber]